MWFAAMRTERPKTVQLFPGDVGVFLIPCLTSGGSHGAVGGVPSGCYGEFAGELDSGHNLIDVLRAFKL